MQYSLKEYLRAELFNNKEFSRIQLLKMRFLHSSLNAIYLLRSYQVWSRDKTHKLRRQLHYRALNQKYGIYLTPNSVIGIGLKLPHPNGIFFGDFVKIGENATIYQQVTFGVKNSGGKQTKDYPSVGNNCIFYTGCKILGNIHIEDNAVIGANAVVIKDVPCGGVAVGVPAKIIDKNAP